MQDVWDISLFGYLPVCQGLRWPDPAILSQTEILLEETKKEGKIKFKCSMEV